MKLNVSGMAFLGAELTKREMFAIYWMRFNKEMPDQITKADLVRIVHVLCKKLNWIEQDYAEALTPNSGNGKAVNSLDFSSSTVSQPTNHGRLDRDPLEIPTDSSQFGFETANKDVESDRNVSADEKECQENYNCEIIKSEAITSSENIDMDKTGDKSFCCSQCDYNCSISIHLKRQERTRTGDEPFSCSQ